MIIDLSSDITYNGLSLNNTLNAASPVNSLVGYTVEEFRILPVDAVGYREKRSLADGFDYGPVYLGKRDLFLRGVAYGSSGYDLSQKCAELRAALTPTLCYRADPLNHGFLPLVFSVPYWQTHSIEEFTLYARPYEQPGNFVIAETVGRNVSAPSTFIWEARFECRDPRFYLDSVQYDLSEGLYTTATVHGNGAAPVNFTIVLADSGALTLSFNGFGSVFTLSVPAGLAANTIVTVDSGLKVVTVKEPLQAEVLRMDLISFAAGKTWPLASEGANILSATLTSGTPPVSAFMVYRESYY